MEKPIFKFAIEVYMYSDYLYTLCYVSDLARADLIVDVFKSDDSDYDLKIIPL